MPYIIRIIGLAAGGRSGFDGQYVKHYDPSYVNPSLGYDGGLLDVTPYKSQAAQYDSPATAMVVWRQLAPAPYHLRRDGKPNRPLTAFTVEVYELESGI